MPGHPASLWSPLHLMPQELVQREETEGEREAMSVDSCHSSTTSVSVCGLPEGWTACTEEDLREGPTSLTEETERRNEWQARASASDTLCV